ncbi:DUF2975 domain-containing protein [Nonlabens sp. YIK11]|uniref:DUF2975 domain-containing protein n=1 Tax=Nonlabens sp. YIK11 TaxID=1453349 RepID=UPI0039774CD2
MFFFVALKDPSFHFQVSNYDFKNVHWSFYLVITCAIISQYLFLGMIHQMRGAARLLKKLNFLRIELSRLLYQAGILCVVGVLLNRVPPFFYNMFHMLPNKSVGSSTTLSLLYSFDSMLIVVCFGIFLIIPSKIIQYSIGIKQENDLTI